LVLHRTRIGKYANEKFIINGQWRNKLFLIVISRFSLEMAAMNAPRICKLRKTVLPALTSAQWCYQKSTNSHFYDCKMQNGKKFIPHALQIFTAHI
jgi:hypothetical protein